MKKLILSVLLVVSLTGCSTAVKYGLQEQGIRQTVDTNVKYCTTTVGNVTKWHKCGYK